MARKKKSEEVVQEEAPVLTFSKRQLVKAKRYSRYSNFLKGNLEDKAYTLEEVDALINKYYGGK